MIELTLEQANRILEYMDPEYPKETAEQFDAVRALMGKVREESERYAPKPCPRFTVWESRDFDSSHEFIIHDTVDGVRYGTYSSKDYIVAQAYADDLNRCESVTR